MQEITEWINTYTGLKEATQWNIMESVIIFVVLLIIRKLLLKLINRFNDDVRQTYRWRNVVNYVTFIIGVIMIGRIWFEGMQSLATYLGLLSAGIALALREPIVNIAGWAFIIFRRPFNMGDRIQIGNAAGDVIDIGLFQFAINEIGNWVDGDQSTGRIIHIPNSKVFSEYQANYTEGFGYIWNELTVMVSYQSDWKKAKRLLTDLINKHTEKEVRDAQKALSNSTGKYMLMYSKLTPIVYTKAKDNGIALSIRYLIKPRARRQSEEVLWEEILTIFADDPEIDFFAAAKNPPPPPPPIR